ncbi:MAG: 4-demethylwyosine synthase TYW1 [Candidatus Pacearchaeota archaeon]|nr:4-demethylwyosine synthase TYW1 [Candidatus Pacearchaeota archaeon]
MIPAQLELLLKKQHYALVGKNKHSAVQICNYTKQSIRGKDICYKEKFYGIKSHRCCQMTPAIEFCQHKCVFCWRAIEHNQGINIPKIDNPKEIIDECMKAQKKLLAGFGGSKDADKKKFQEAQTPNQFAISLSGEPTIYKKLPELLDELKQRNITSFVVSNGENPEMLKKINPTQLYVSMIAPNEPLFKKISNSCYKDCWKRYLKALKLLKLKSKTTRTVLRLTLIKGLNMLEPENYSKLITLATPDFIEIKSYMHVGFSQKRLKRENMPLHEEVNKFAQELLKFLPNYKLIGEKEISRVVLLSNGKKNKLIA